MRTDWFERAAEPAAPPAEGQRTLDEISKERAMTPSALPNPTGNPEPTEKMSLKELSGLMESAAKSLLDAKLAMEKANVGLSKVSTMSGPSGMDKEIAGKAQGFAASTKNIGDSIEALAQSVSAYREELSKPKGSWLE